VKRGRTRAVVVGGGWRLERQWASSPVLLCCASASLIVGCVSSAGMDSSTHAAVVALTCGHDHEVRLLEDNGSLFLV
jgi:hypothetical protein